MRKQESGTTRPAITIEQLRQTAKDSQIWENDKAFNMALARSGEKGFTSLEDYHDKRAKMSIMVASAAKDRKSGASERNSSVLLLARAYNQLKPAIWIIGLVIFVGVGLRTGAFFPRSPEHSGVFATMEQQAGMAGQEEQVEHIQIQPPAQNTEQVQPASLLAYAPGALAGAGAICLFFWYRSNKAPVTKLQQKRPNKA